MSLHVNLSSQTFFRNPAAEIEKMRAAGPVIEVHIPIIGKVWTTTTQDLSDRVLRDSDSFTSAKKTAASPVCGGGCRASCALWPAACWERTIQVIGGFATSSTRRFAVARW